MDPERPKWAKWGELELKQTVPWTTSYVSDEYPAPREARVLVEALLRSAAQERLPHDIVPPDDWSSSIEE
jgi:hypothetical protein